MKPKKSYYKQEDGVKYDRALLEKADELSQGDGRISKADATALVEESLDAFQAKDRGTPEALTGVEGQTLKKIYEEGNFTQAGRDVFEQANQDYGLHLEPAVHEVPGITPDQQLKIARNSVLHDFEHCFLPSADFKATFRDDNDQELTWADAKADVTRDTATFGTGPNDEIHEDPDGSRTFTGYIWGVYTEVSVDKTGKVQPHVSAVNGGNTYFEID